MSDFFTGLKIFITAVLTSISTVLPVAAPIHTQTQISTPSAIVSSSSTPIPSAIPTVNPSSNSSPTPISPKQSPLPLNGENYIYIQGTYSYLGQAIKYLFLVPRKGGSFSGAIQGACQAQVGGNYEGGNGGKISGGVGGTCTMFGVKIQGSTNFNGRLYPDTKTIVLDIDNSPIHGLAINYN